MNGHMVFRQPKEIIKSKEKKNEESDLLKFTVQKFKWLRRQPNSDGNFTR